MVQQRGLVDGAGVVVQTPGNGEVYGEVLRRNAEVSKVAHHGSELLQARVKGLIAALIALQGGENLLVAAGDGDEPQDLIRLLRGDGEVLHQDGLDFLGADLVQLVHRAHHIGGLLTQPQAGIKAVEDFPVVHPDLEPLQAQRGEGLVDDGGDLRLIDDGELAVADDVDVRLIELPETAPLGPFTPVDLADLVTTEGEGEVVVVQCHVLGQRHRQVKAQAQVAVALLKAVDLLFRLAAGLGQQHVAGLDDGGIQGGEAVEGIGAPEDLHDALHLLLGCRQQFHKAGQRPGGHFCHDDNSF